jgi:hypothetical protein
MIGIDGVNTIVRRIRGECRFTAPGGDARTFLKDARDFFPAGTPP